MTQRAVNQFAVDRGRTLLSEHLAQYYQTHGTWHGAAGVLQHELARRQDPGHRHPLPPMVVVGTSGQVVLSTTGRYPVDARVPAADRTDALPINPDGAVVGWLLLGVDTKGLGPDAPEAHLLARITQAITESAIGAVALALLLGVLLARTLTQPIRELTEATQVMAKGKLGQQVTVRTQDELGVLAASFNRMSADLAHASNLRRQMTADIAHDLRTPLSVILGYTEALRDGTLLPDQEIFDALHTEAQHLQHVIDDLRTLALADAGELTLTRQRVVPGALLERTAAAYRAQAEAQEVTLSVQSGARMPEVDVDPERIAHVLGNLLSNALRYTRAGGTITLAATVQAETVQLCVQDTGTGIAPEALPHIFERCYRADPSRQHENGSSGLGLAIAKSIVEAHGGTIGVESTVGRGTTFTINLPVPTRTPSTLSAQHDDRVNASMSPQVRDV